MAAFIAFGHRLRHVGPAHAADLPLLFHVRLPAHRRPRSGPSATSAAGASWRAAPPGRTTLQGEGLQHDDGHSPCCSRRSTRRAHLRPGLRLRDRVDHGGRHRRIYGPEPEDRFWYLTLYNENYPMPPLPAAGRATPSARASSAACYRFAGRAERPAVQRRTAPRILFSGPCGRRPSRPASCSPSDWGVAADAWSVTSLHRAARGRPVGRALEPPPPRRRARDSLVTEPSATAPARSWRSRTTCGPCRTRWRAGYPARSSRSAPTASAAPTPAPRCAASSRSTPRTSSSPCSTALRRDRRGQGRRGRRSHRPLRHRRRLGRPLVRLTRHRRPARVVGHDRPPRPGRHH